MSDPRAKGHMDRLARYLAKRPKPALALTGVTVAGGSTDIATSVQGLPLPIGSVGQVVCVVDDGGDIVWSYCTPHVQITLGPFYINDLPGTATTQATLGYFDDAAAVSRASNDVLMDAACHVIGILVVADAARTAGTATARVRVNGSGTAFNAGAVVLDGTRTVSDSSFVVHADGVAIAAGQTVGVEIVTSSWTPTTADLSIFIVVSLD